MIQTNEGLNTSRMVANNGQDFIEDTDTHTGVWFGFQPGSTCKLSEITITNSNGDTLTQADDDWSQFVGTTNDLNSFIGAGLVTDSNLGIITKGYITSIKLASGFCTMYRDTINK